MKLTIEHLAPYLPYNVKCLVTWTGRQKGLTREVLLTSKNISYAYSWKLILRPLSDLTKEIEHKRERFVPLVRLFDTLRPYDKYSSYSNGRTNNQIWFYNENGEELYWIMYDSNELFFDIRTKKENRLLQVFQYEAFKKLFEWHFDVFGLIDKGLAININETETTKP